MSDWREYHPGVDPVLDEIIARRFGSAHEKPCIQPQVVTCTRWECQAGDCCILTPPARPATPEKRDE